MLSDVKKKNTLLWLVIFGEEENGSALTSFEYPSACDPLLTERLGKDVRGETEEQKSWCVTD